MKKILIIPAICAVIALASCSGTNQHGAATDSPENTTDTMTADTVIHGFDTTSTGVPNSATGGTSLLDTAVKE